MIGRFSSWLAGDGLKSVVRELGQARGKRLNARNGRERAGADERAAPARASRFMSVNGRGGGIAARWTGPALASPFVIYDRQIVFFNNVLGLSVTDIPSSPRRIFRPVACEARCPARALERLR